MSVKTELESLIKETKDIAKEMAEGFKEIRERFKETDLKFKETAERFKETDIKFKESREEMKKLENLFTGQWGKLIEALVTPSVLKLFQERGIKVTETATRVEKKYNGRTMEIDIIASNDEVVIPIEVKTTLKVSDVKEFIDNLKEFFTFFQRYRGMKLYGAVSCINIDENADRFAYKNGLFVLVLSGENTIVIKNDKEFIPKDYGKADLES